MEYGENMKYIRQLSEMTQKEIADILGIARSTYNQYEQQYNIIPLKTLYDFCTYFKVPIDYILGLNKKMNHKEITSKIDLNISSKRIRLIRKENKMLQKELAEKIHIANSVLCEYEKGHFLISTATLYSICKLFNISADYLLGLSEQKYLKSIKNKELIMH